MSKKIILILVVVVFLSKFNLAQADVVINEFISHPNTGDTEWVELSSSDSQDLSGWSLTDLANPGKETQHENSPKSLSGLTIPANGVLVIEVSGLNDTGDSISLYNGTTLVDRVTYGKVTDISADLAYPLQGMSGVLISGSWKTNQDSTKDELNPGLSASSSDTNTDSGDENILITTIPPEPKTDTVKNPTMKAKILSGALAFTGEPLSIKTNVTGFSDENVVLGRVYWNFGDGGSLEQTNNFEEFYHTYYYPGEYILFLEYYQNNFSKTPEAVNKMIIKVLPTSVIISKIGDVKDFFVELSNIAPSDIDISNWVIRAGGKTFVLPKNTIIMSKKPMTVSGKITGFAYGDQYDLKLFSGTGELVFDYSPKALPVKVLAKSLAPVKVSTAIQPIQASALAINSQIPESPDGPYSSPIIPVVSAVFIGTSAYGVYFIRRKKTVSVSAVGNDFEILDE